MTSKGNLPSQVTGEKLVKSILFWEVALKQINTKASGNKTFFI